MQEASFQLELIEFQYSWFGSVNTVWSFTTALEAMVASCFEVGKEGMDGHTCSHYRTEKENTRDPEIGNLDQNSQERNQSLHHCFIHENRKEQNPR